MVMQLMPTCDRLEPLKIISMFRALLQQLKIGKITISELPWKIAKKLGDRIFGTLGLNQSMGPHENGPI